MKISLALGTRRPLSRQTAWGCLTTNLGMPGFGSLAAGRVAGYPQAVLCLLGLAVSVFFGMHFMWWAVSNWSRLHSPDADPVAALGEMWTVGRWAFFGLAIFAFSWVWALLTSLQILGSARQTEPTGVPPRLN